LASGSGDDTVNNVWEGENAVKLWSVESQKEITTLRGHGDIVYSVAFSPDGKYLASGSGDDTVKLWSVESQEEVTTL
jgi:WD40 repeat protein